VKALRQLWQLVPARDGWSRLQLKNTQQYLYASDCTTELGAMTVSYAAKEDDPCQLWRLDSSKGR